MPGSTSRPLATKGGDGTSHLGNMATIGQDWSSILLDVACQLILGPMYELSNYGLCRSCDRCESDLRCLEPAAQRVPVRDSWQRGRGESM